MEDVAQIHILRAVIQRPLQHGVRKKVLRGVTRGYFCEVRSVAGGIDWLEDVGFVGADLPRHLVRYLALVRLVIGLVAVRIFDRLLVLEAELRLLGQEVLVEVLVDEFVLEVDGVVIAALTLRWTQNDL